MIDSFITYLSAELAADNYNEIQHAWNMDPIEKKRAELPALYLFPGSEATAEDGTDFLVSHRLNLTVHVHLVCLIENLDDLKTSLRTAAIGWNAGAGYEDLSLKGGNTLLLKGGVIWWEDIYSNYVTLREVYS